MKRRRVGHYIIMALYTNEKPLSRHGIWAELPRAIAPNTLDALSVVLTNLKHGGYIQNNERSWTLTEKGMEHAVAESEVAAQ